MSKNFTHVAFTDSVRQLQTKNGTRATYQRFENAGDRYQLSARETRFIEARRHFYLATVGANGWPYVQHRGGPTGLLKVLDSNTLGFADFAGNGQFISAGNLSDNAKASIILVDYQMKQRIKIWATTQVVDPADDPALLQRLHDEQYDAKVLRMILLDVQAFDWNCPQHIDLG